jgi:hypothetical protein
MHGATGLGGGVVGTFLTWVWRVARIEPQIKLDIKAAKDEIEGKLEMAEQRAEEKIEKEIGHFRDTLSALREKINEVEKEAVRKEDFDDFRKEHRQDFQQLRQENREDFADLKRNVAQILGQRQ